MGTRLRVLVMMSSWSITTQSWPWRLEAHGHATNSCKDVVRIKYIGDEDKLDYMCVLLRCYYEEEGSGSC